MPGKVRVLFLEAVATAMLSIRSATSSSSNSSHPWMKWARMNFLRVHNNTHIHLHMFWVYIENFGSAAKNFLLPRPPPSTSPLPLLEVAATTSLVLAWKSPSKNLFPLPTYSYNCHTESHNILFPWIYPVRTSSIHPKITKDPPGCVCIFLSTWWN